MLFLVSLIGIVYSTQLTLVEPSLTIPSTKNASMPVNVADFGYVPYGRTVGGNLTYVENTCNPLNITLNSNIVLTMGATCKFLAQAMNVQSAGGKMLVIIYNHEEDISNFLLIAEYGSQQSFIPTMMINKADGEFLIEKLESMTIYAQVSFELKQQEIVDLQYFLSSFDVLSYLFLDEFLPFAKQMINKITFDPIYIQFYCKECEKTGYKATNQNCISGGRYCGQDPDQNGPLTGRDVILEDLRQICILQKYDLITWWNYMILFNELCFNNYQECPSKIMKSISINETIVNDCMTSSFVGKNTLLDDNTILKEQRYKIMRNHQVYWPSLYINGEFYKGDLYLNNADESTVFDVDDFAVLEAICDGFLDDSRPTLCNATGFFSIKDGELQDCKYNQFIFQKQVP
ncbi:unnamed protein product (macronuclear) [Paramecium tetraurelia]|uniref:PA domain-containing protein n=1 Tax=Paramecium tetraurelia TaxID=5888 RepID=A0E199_PARTE|nr:uncharacterized protein GSPATT00022235001 [Paramecium tetraurelia]CAK89066.1 unnamed protein product [Paramecium tetraurelia]|eukprot:XP_001456463.1 hypothetical protein (macronuclear) [Paramecium tetraurelia strain d4-2]